MRRLFCSESFGNNMLKNLFEKIFKPSEKKRLNVLLWGSTARDHAIAWKLSQSEMLNKLYLVGPNDGYKNLGESVNADGYELLKMAREKQIDLIVVGTEGAQIKGIADAFKKIGIKCIGVTKAWAQLEASKSFGKDFMTRNSILTPNYKLTYSFAEFENAISKCSFPVVIKSDFIISNSGEGVLIANSIEEAMQAAEKFFSKHPVDIKNRVIIEEYIKGDELSLISFWDGKTLVPLLPTKDYKKLLDWDKGPNTAGLGAYCPVKITEKKQKLISQYLKKLKKALKKEGADFTGIIYSGAMFDEKDMYILEFNIRLGDPEGQVLLKHMDSDLLEIFYLMSKKQLSKVKIKWKEGISACVVIAGGGYPNLQSSGSKITLPKDETIDVFYCGVKEEDNGLVSNGGRIMSVCKTSINPYNDIYNFVEKIEMDDKYYRKDIGK